MFGFLYIQKSITLEGTIKKKRLKSRISYFYGLGEYLLGVEISSTDRKITQKEEG